RRRHADRARRGAHARRAGAADELVRHRLPRGRPADLRRRRRRPHLVPAPAGGGMTARGTLIRDVRVFDGGRVVEADAALMREGLIAEVGPGAAGPGDEVVDGRGGTLLPGLIDGHAHPSPADLGRALTFGVTIVLHMFCGPGL